MIRQSTFDYSGIKRHRLSCGDGHHLHICEAGPPDGIPLVIFHGGPGSGSHFQMLAPVNLRRFRVVMIDQRGSGRSRPLGRLQRNMTAWLIRDIEAVRHRLNIRSWYVLGGSWGATLALVYAGMHPSSVRGLVLRGTFLASQQEIRQLLTASRHTAGQAWQRLYRASQADRPQALLRAVHERLKLDSRADSDLALAYENLERAVLARGDRSLSQRPQRKDERRHRQLRAKYQVQTHYLLHACGLRQWGLGKLAAQIKAAGIAVIAIHGRRDPLCPTANLIWLERHIPQTKTVLVDAGHLAHEPSVVKAISDALAEFSQE